MLRYTRDLADQTKQGYPMSLLGQALAVPLLTRTSRPASTRLTCDALAMDQLHQVLKSPASSGSMWRMTVQSSTGKPALAATSGTAS